MTTGGCPETHVSSHDSAHRAKGNFMKRFRNRGNLFSLFHTAEVETCIWAVRSHVSDPHH